LPAVPEASPLAVAQAAWRFYANDRLGLDHLSAPPIQHARDAVAAGVCDEYVLVAYDWCALHYNGHGSKGDRVEVGHRNDLGYKLLTALAIGDRDGAPLAPLCLELRAADGVHSTRAATPLKAESSLDSLAPVMAHVRGLELGVPVVSVIDREADSVGHYRAWAAAGERVVVRADDARLVLHGGAETGLDKVAGALRDKLVDARAVEFKGKPARQFVGETTVVLHRPARPQRIDKRKRGKVKKRRKIPGPRIAMRLIVSQVRDAKGRVLARWLLLSNLPGTVPAATVALWYYWRWRIESYHKLLKGAGQQIECWQQETAEALARRLCVVAMSCVVVWQLARDQSPEGAKLREVLVRAGGRQMKRGKDAAGNPRRTFTEPALLAGLGVLIPALELLETHALAVLRALARKLLPRFAQHKPSRDGGEEDV
jgi:hypothetical protein